MKSISLFVLLVYWSVIILAPVLSKELKFAEKEFSSEDSQQTRDDNSSSSRNLPLGTFDSINFTCLSDI